MTDNRASFIAGIIVVAALVIIAFLLGIEILRPSTGKAPNDFPFDALDDDTSGGHHAAHNHGCHSPAGHHGSGISDGWGGEALLIAAALVVVMLLGVFVKSVFVKRRQSLRDNWKQKPEHTEPQEQNPLTIPRHLR